MKKFATLETLLEKSTVTLRTGSITHSGGQIRWKLKEHILKKRKTRVSMRNRLDVYFTFPMKRKVKTHSCSVSTPISLYCSSCLIWASSCLSLESWKHNRWNYNAHKTHMYGGRGGGSNKGRGENLGSHH